MPYRDSHWRRIKRAARFLIGPTPATYKLLWLKTHAKAMLFGLGRLVVLNRSIRIRLRHKQQWYRGIYDEFEWWREWLITSEGQDWLETVQDPQCPVQDHLVVKLVEKIADNTVHVLDVGSGPVTHLGYKCPGKRLVITAADPLFGMYGRLLNELRVVTPVKNAACFGEQLLDRFEPASFDIVYASNSLDHSQDPLVVLTNMLALVKPGGFVVLRHYRNEGETGDYHGLHQWNFDLIDGDLVIWNASEWHNISKTFTDKVQLQSHIEDGRSHGVFDHSDWVVGVLQKI